jgi:hypothetical protein
MKTLALSLVLGLSLQAAEPLGQLVPVNEPQYSTSSSSNTALNIALGTVSSVVIYEALPDTFSSTSKTITAILGTAMLATMLGNTKDGTIGASFVIVWDGLK